MTESQLFAFAEAQELIQRASNNSIPHTVIPGSVVVKASRPAAPPSKKKLSTDSPGKIQVEGWGNNDEDAIQDAYENAREKILEALREKGGTLEGQLPASKINDLLSGEARHHDEQGSTRSRREPKEHALAMFEFDLNSRVIEKLLTHDRQFRATNRMAFLGRGLGFFVAFLAALSGYFRLEEATKGYYTTWLRLAAASFLGAVAAGLWFTK